MEFFAGKANAFKIISSSGYPSCAVDIEYLKNADVKGNAMDILTPEGFGLGAYRCVCVCVCLSLFTLNPLSPPYALIEGPAPLDHYLNPLYKPYLNPYKP